MNTVPALGWVAIGFGLCFALTIIAVCIIDPILIWQGKKTISRRTLEATQRSPTAAVFIAAVLALISGLLIGHLELGQSPAGQRSASCSCKACACDPTCRCDDKTPAPVAAMPAVPAGLVALASFHADAPPEKLRIVLKYAHLGVPSRQAEQVHKDWCDSPLRDQFLCRFEYTAGSGDEFAIEIRDAGGKVLHRQTDYGGGWKRLRDVLLRLQPCQQPETIAAQPVPDPKPILLGFTQRINPVCVKMKRELDRRPDVKKAVAEKYDLRLYHWGKDKDMCDKYAVRDVPTAILLDVTGKEVRRFSGYKTPNEILRWLDLPCPQ